MDMYSHLFPANFAYAKARKQWGSIKIEFPAASPITAGSRRAATPTTNGAGWYFIVQEIVGSILLAAASGSAVIGTPLPHDGPVASNVATLPSINTILLNLGDTNSGWVDSMTPFGLVCGRPGELQPLGSPLLLDPQASILAELDNQSNAGGATGVSIYGFITLRGIRVYK